MRILKSTAHRRGSKNEAPVRARTVGRSPRPGRRAGAP
ncbi:hypothetical protein BX283_0956 [Streptomyces sp. TLI_146]|nr:hypothetical protein BX283_0956 [Streptomyces sp. TLI_146]